MIAPGKDHSTLNTFKIDLENHGGNAFNILDVSCDMSPAFIKGINKFLSNAKITFDKFHIIKLINEAVDKTRRADAKLHPVILKGCRYIFLKNKQNLSETQEKKKLELKDLNLDSMKALQMREAFQAIYTADTAEDFVVLLKEWHEWVSCCDIEPMVQIATMVHTHWDGIVRWKETQINNGILEGLNSVIQAAKRKARGYGRDHFIMMTYLITGKFNYEKINRYY